MNALVVARWREDTAWTTSIPWTTITVQKDLHTPNVGREASSYLWAIRWLYPHISPADTWAFVQGDPFPHCPDLTERLAPVDGFEWLAPLRSRCSSDHLGRPHHGGLPVGPSYERWTGQPFPTAGVQFAPGGQFAAPGRLILTRPRDYWADLYREALDAEARTAWVMERLWQHIFDNGG